MTGRAQATSATATYRVLRELGRRSQRSYAAAHGDGSIVVLHRFTRDPKSDGELVSAAEMAILLRDARCLERNWHPNVARVRHVDLANDELHLATELLDGVTLEELIVLARARQADTNEPVLPLAIFARIILDVLSGLHAFHSLRDARSEPLSAFHGELCPANVVVGKDGVARIVCAFRPRPVTIGPQSEGLGYASPEALAREPKQDARADVYSVGVMLWEALANSRLFDDVDPSRIAHRQRAEDFVHPDGPLADVAMRALAFDPALRFRTAQEMATDLRAAAEAIAPGSTVAQTILQLAGDRIRARRMELDPQASGRYRPSSGPPPTRSGTHVRASDPSLMRAPLSTDAPPPPVPAVQRRALPKASPPVLPPPRRRATSFAAIGPQELRVGNPSAPDGATSYAPRPLPPRRPSGAPPPPPGSMARPPALGPLPRVTAPTASSFPPPANDDDLPGPRESTPDHDYVEQLAKEIRAAEASLVSAPPPVFVAPPMPGAEWRAASTRTPFVVNLSHHAPPPVMDSPWTVGVRRTVPIAAAIAAAVLFLFVVGATILVRSARNTAAARANADGEVSPPSTVVTAPARAEETPLPPRSAAPSALPLPPTAQKPVDARPR